LWWWLRLSLTDGSDIDHRTASDDKPIDEFEASMSAQILGHF
jgi:hypothetical protein